jgi:sialate O-acetylesterase
MSLTRVLALAAVACTARAEVKLPAIFSDHMVLQADKGAAVWGWAKPAEKVTVSIAGQTKSVEAGPDGKWTLRLDPLKTSSQTQTLTVRGTNTLTINDVLIGEVWLASGQSNMEMKIKDKMHGTVDGADEAIAAATHPEIRLFVHDQPYAIYDTPVPPAEPQTDRPGRWRVCSPKTVVDFTAIGYFFARDVNAKIHAPIGIVCSAVGGTPIEAWTSLEAQQHDPTLKPMLDDWEKRLAGVDPEKEQKTFLEKKDAWLKERTAATKAGQPIPKAPSPFKNLRVMAPGALFNGMIAPLVPYTVRGVIWYQGEKNSLGTFTGLYGVQLQKLIADWRTRWSDDQLYFAWVQLPGSLKEQKDPSEPKGWAVLVRDGMRCALSVPHTGMAITMDLNGKNAGHPTNKEEFATRLSRVVLHDIYGQGTDPWSGPLFRAAQRDGAKMVLTFDQSKGLKAGKGGELDGFAIAGSDQKFVWAKAQIADGKVIVSSDTVPEPVAVRYSWAGNPKGNLVNAADLPASPFRTDDWK